MNKKHLRKRTLFLFPIISAIIVGTFLFYIIPQMFMQPTTYSLTTSTFPSTTTSINPSTVLRPTVNPSTAGGSSFQLNIESPENKTYLQENIIIQVSTSESAQWMMNSIDGDRNITACYNCDSYSVYYLKFQRGTHTIQVYASDYQNNIISSTAIFTIA